MRFIWFESIIRFLYISKENSRLASELQALETKCSGLVTERDSSLSSLAQMRQSHDDAQEHFRALESEKKSSDKVIKFYCQFFRIA